MNLECLEGRRLYSFRIASERTARSLLTLLIGILLVTAGSRAQYFGRNKVRYDKFKYDGELGLSESSRAMEGCSPLSIPSLPFSPRFPLQVRLEAVRLSRRRNLKRDGKFVPFVHEI